MHKNTKISKNAILILFLIIFIVKLIICFQTSNLNNESYFHLQQAKEILNSGKPEMQNYIYDNAALPILSYVLAFFGIFINFQIAAKVLITLLSTSLIVIIYFISYEIIRDKKISLIVAMFSGFIPIIFKGLINNFSTLGATLFMYALTLLFFIKSMNNTKYIRQFIIFLILLIFISPLSLLFIASFVIYFLLLKAEKMKIRLSEIEIFLFSLILGGWIYIIIYKKAIVEKGFLYFLHPIISNTTSMSNLTIISLISVVPVLLGIIGIYQSFMKKTNRQSIFTISLIITSLIFMMLNIIEQNFALSLIAFCLVICAAIALKDIKKYFSTSKIKKTYSVIVIILVILFIITSIVPSVTNALIETHNTLSNNDEEALTWIKTNIEKDSIVFGSIEESYTISYFSDKENIFQENILNQNYIEKIKDSKNFFISTLSTESIRILSLYDVSYVFLSEKNIEKMNPQVLAKFEDECFQEIYNNGSRVYKRRCVIKKEIELNEEIFEDNDEEKI